MSHHSRRWPLVVLVVFWSFVSAALQAATVAPLTLPGDPGLDPSGLPPIYFRARELLRHRRVPTSTPLPSMKWTPLQPPTIEYEYVDVTVTLSPPSNQIAVDIVLSLKGTTNGGLQLELLLEQPLKPICRDEQSNLLSCTYDNTKSVLRIELDRPLEPGEVRKLRVIADGVLDCGESQTWCQIDKELSYLLGGSYIPLPQEPKSRFPGTLRVDVPDSYVVAATGFLTGVDESKVGRRRYIFSHDEPTMLYSFAVAPFDVQRLQPEAGIDIGVFSLGDGKKQAPQLLEYLQQVLEFYSDQLAPYPFEKLDAVTIDDKFGGGFGPLATIFVSRFAFSYFSKEAYSESTRELFAHEVAHQWWGHQRDQYGFDDWIVTESLAEFSAMLFAHERGNDAHLYDNLQSYLIGFTRSKDRSLYPYDSGGLSSSQHFLLLYARGSVTFMQLRELIGAEAFDDGLRSLFVSTPFEYLSVPQLRQALIDRAGPKAGTLFDRFVTAKGFPELTLRVRRPPLSPVAPGDPSPGPTPGPPTPAPIPEPGTPPPGPGAPFPTVQPGTVVVEVSHGALPFEMPLRLAVETESGVFVQELALTDSALPQSFVVTLDRPLRSLRVLPTPIYLKTFESALAGDIDLNGEVDGADLVELAIHYRRALTVTHQNQRIVTPDADWLFTADCNGDTVVDEKDLAVLRAAYGQRNE